MNGHSNLSRTQSNPIRSSRRTSVWTWILASALLLSIVANPLLVGQSVHAQEEAGNAAEMIDASDIESVMNEAPTEGQQLGSDQPSGIDLLSLITRGGWFMLPIGLMSMLVVTLTVERSLSLRTKKIIPPGLVEQLGDLMVSPDKFPPTTAFEICQEHRSPASRVIQSMLMRTGQPLGEIERAGTETIQREADRYASLVRWLTLAAAATPLMGLLGTVWGMIVAFHESSTLTADRSRSEQLSEGIYTALVTTLAGLIVAIPAAIFAQYLENRITKLFQRIEELAFAIAPGLARFAGRSKLDYEGNLRPMEGTPPPPMGSPTPPIEHSHSNGSPAPPPVATQN
ncbi:MotA/TolQ/ExbB proton channel family protein [Neorhodopirellula pilleata]|uniref:Colicin uptake protein TolQ n=1 Tax=Neorhodopirellula pilleata TaxID=2714738 RepID=A0A5C6A804_9BACT|nr:MotA/TolQ/ExbB proton channel family protein [Neorhodopirellula pilleata]TWT95455.1 colicin uptake protein TolQ [Neorhodopirellula pilleata]